MAALQYTFADLYGQVGWFIYQDRTPAAAADLVRVKRIANEGYLHFLGDRNWRFLSPQTYLTLAVPETDITDATADDPGNIEAVGHGLLTGDTVTISGVEGMTELNGNTYTVTYVDDDNFTIGVDTSAYTAYTSDGTVTGPPRTALPADFGELMGGFNYSPGSILNRIEQTTPEHIRAMRQSGAMVSADPRYFAIEPLTFVTATGQRWQVTWFPTPSVARTVYYQYRVQAAALSADADYPLGGPDHAMAIRECCLWYAEQDKGITDGMHGQKYRNVDLPRSISIDARLGANNMGPVTNGPRGTWDGFPPRYLDRASTNLV